MLSTILAYQSPSVGGYLADSMDVATRQIIGASDILFPATLDQEFLTRFLTDNEQAANHLGSLERSKQSEPDCPVRPLFTADFFNNNKLVAVLCTNSNVEGPIQPHHLAQPTFALVWLHMVLNTNQAPLQLLPSMGLSSKQAYQMLSNLRWFLYSAMNWTEIPNLSSTLLGAHLLE